MAYNIGLLDYDVIRTKHYLTPNYDLGVTYAYYKGDKNINIRFVSSLSPKNLSQYDKIYIFKRNKRIAHPSGYIPNYYQYPMEEYGEGFLNKPLRPNLLETRYLAPDFSCYNNMLLFTMEHPKHPLSWNINKKAKGKDYQGVRLYEKLDGEDLKKDYPTSKKIIVYDNPIDLLTDPDKWAYYNELLDKKHKILFAQSLDISLLNDTNILEQVLTESKYAPIRAKLIASDINDVMNWLVDFMLTGKCKKQVHILVKLPIETSPEICFEYLMLMNYYNHKTDFKLKLRPMWDRDYLEHYTLALLAFNYLTGRPEIMSYYEYVFNIACLSIGVPKYLIHTGEEQYENIFAKYGMADLLVKMEEWIQAHPQFEESVFIGGDSNYEKSRRKYYELRGSTRAFTTSAYNIG